MNYFTVLVVVVQCIFSYQDQVPARVQISQGIIEGTILKNSVTGKDYYAFQGVPFAQPPIGTLRFEAPQKLNKSDKVIEAKSDSQQCIQERGGSEDCLYLNIFSNEIDEKKLKPVMVFFYPGRFVEGDNSIAWNNPEYLLEEDIVLVVPAYRLNVFGFLSTQDSFAEGNAGLKDQVAALQWVKENINKFGGDSNAVTIFGISAGGASVHYLSLSPLAKGLFHRAIIQSGSAISEWAFQPKPKTRALELALALGIETNDTKIIMEHLRTVDARKLFIYSDFEHLGRPDGKSVFQFAPSVERVHDGAFMTKSPFAMLMENETANVEYMIGYAQQEGSVVIPAPFGEIRINFVDDAEVKEHIENNDKLVPKTLNLRGSPESKKVIEEIKLFFFQNETLKNETKFINFVGHYMFVKNIRKSVEIMKQNRNVYFYKNNYKEASHTSDRTMLFKITDLKDQDRMVSRKMIKMWTNFAKTGNPTPTQDPMLDSVIWKKASSVPGNGTAILNIAEKLTMKENLDQEYFYFWENIYQKYGKTPFYAY